MKLTPEAWMRMRASPGPGVGVGRSRRVRASAVPGAQMWMYWMGACMRSCGGEFRTVTETEWRRHHSSGHGRLRGILGRLGQVVQCCDGAVLLDRLDSLLHRRLGGVGLTLAYDFVVLRFQNKVGLRRLRRLALELPIVRRVLLDRFDAVERAIFRFVDFTRQDGLAVGCLQVEHELIACCRFQFVVY